MRNLSKKAKTIIAGAAIAGLASTGVAYAYWTTTGSGTGSAATGTTTAITVNQTSTPTAMFPGSTPQSLNGDFTNPNSGAVSITSVTAAVTSITGAGTGALGCTPVDYDIAGSFGPYLVPAGPGTVGTWTGLTIQLKNTALNQDDCKNAVAHVTYTVNP